MATKAQQWSESYETGESRAMLGFFHTLWRRKGTIAAIAIVSIGLGAAFLYVSPPVHKISARLLVQPTLPPSTEQRVRSTALDKDFIGTQAEIVRSPTVVEQAVSQYDLNAPVGSETEPVVAISSVLGVTPVLGTHVLNVSYQDADAAEGLRTVEGIITAYREYLCGIEQDSHYETLRLLTRNEKELRKELKTLETAYRTIREQSPLMGQGKEAAAVQTALLTHLGQTLGDTKNRRIGLENQVRASRAIQSARKEGAAKDAVATSDLPGSFRLVPVALGTTQSLLEQIPATAQPTRGPFPTSGAPSDDIVAIQTQLLIARAREKELAESLGPKHPDLRAVRGQIATWEEVLQTKLDVIPVQLEQELGLAKSLEGELGTLYKDEFQKTKDIDGYLLKEQMAMEEIQRVRSIHDSVLTQLKQRELADEALANGRSGVTVNVLQTPIVEERPAWPPPKLLVLGACAIVGLIGGVGFVSLGERLKDDGEYGETEVEEVAEAIV